MKPIQNFEWNDLILTAKGWYESTGSLTTDFAISLERNDNRSIVISNKNDTKRVASILMNVVMPSLWEALPEDVVANRCWLHHSDDFYRTISDNMRLYECDFDEAVLLAVHNILCNYITKEHIALNKPVYGKGRRRLGNPFHKYPKSMTYAEMNRRAERLLEEIKRV